MMDGLIALRDQVLPVMLSCCFLLSGCERYALDRQMEALCKKDGGIKIYKKVILSVADFSNVGQPLARYEKLAKSREDYLGPDYKYVEIINILTKDVLIGGDAELRRVHILIYRRSDSFLLGESVWYDRSGGDFLTFGFQPSGKSCPIFTKDLANSIFIKEK